MNAVEIEEEVSELVRQPFDAAEFPFQFLVAFGAKDTTIKRLRKGDSNASDVPGGLLQRNNIHIATAAPGRVGDALAALRASPKTASQKAKFILATDGDMVEAEDLIGGDMIACGYADLPHYFATFLPLAGISTVKEIRNNPIDVKATGRLNKLYVRLLTDNPDWATEERRHALNQFMARLIFCYFAEDTGIFSGEGLFTATVARMSQAGHGSGDEQWGNTHEVLRHLFVAMDTPVKHNGNFDERHRRAAGIRPWANDFPYVNGGLFAGVGDCPRFSRAARAYLLSAGELDWKEINPDIFGSMIQAVADDGERGELGMHYTSVPNILKVLNPLFLDDLREQLAAAGDSKPKLRNLRKRLAYIRVFDPACGSGNFLVIAYKQLREIEAAIIDGLGGDANLKLDDRRSVIPLSNFHGIEIKGFAAEIARLALLIAEFQADCAYLSQHEARAMVLPLHKTGQIIVGNALHEDWLAVCPPAEAAGEEWETFVCGNPPYSGSVKQNAAQKADLQALSPAGSKAWKSLDYVCGWFLKGSAYAQVVRARFAFVATNSIVQGEQVPLLWPEISARGQRIRFAHHSFKWTNLAANNAGVTVVVIGVDADPSGPRRLFTSKSDGDEVRIVENINPYLIASRDVIVFPASKPLNGMEAMIRGNMPNDGGHLLLANDDAASLIDRYPAARRYVRKIAGSAEFINSTYRHCLWIEDRDVADASAIPPIRDRIDRVREVRSTTGGTQAYQNRDTPHRFVFAPHRAGPAIIVPRVSSEEREYLPAGLMDGATIISDRAIVMYGAQPHNLAILLSRLHLCWIATVCARLETRLSYSNTLGWNTFPVPLLTEQDKADLTRTAETILLAREAHFPATIADLYDPAAMPADLRRAHDENDDILERIYIGRRFRNDTERLERLFDLYTRMTADKGKRANAA